MRDNIMRKPLTAGNWEMNKADGETKQLTDDLKCLDISDNVEACIMFPSTLLKTFTRDLRDSNISTGA